MRETEIGGQMVYFDYRTLGNNAKLTVEIGPSEYWSESAQIQTMDNLFTKGVITDAIVYLENLPDRALPNKSRIIQAIKENSQINMDMEKRDEYEIM